LEESIAPLFEGWFCGFVDVVGYHAEVFGVLHEGGAHDFAFAGAESSCYPLENLFLLFAEDNFDDWLCH